MKFKRWELVLIVFSVLVVATSFIRLRSDGKLYPRIFGMKDWGSSQEPVIGKLNLAQGDVKRQPNQSTLFKAIQKNSELSNNDLLFTGSESQAKLVLNDGGEVDFGPNTMARIAVENQLGFKGISRIATVDVVSGVLTAAAKGSTILLRSESGQTLTVGKGQNQKFQVDAVPHVKAKELKEQLIADSSGINTIAPVATPVLKAATVGETVAVSSVQDPAVESVKVTVLSPMDGSVFQIAKGSTEFSYPLKVEAKIDLNIPIGPEPLKIAILKGRAESKKENSKTVFARTLELNAPTFVALTQIKSPGTYRVVAEGKTKSTFSIKDEFEAITLYPPKVGGMPLTVVKSEIHSSDNYDVTLRWEPIKQAKEYTAYFASPKNPEKIILEHKVKTPFYSFNIGKVFQGAFLYRIVAQDAGGFKAVSQWDLFDFSLKSPTLTSPANGGEFNANQTIELVWSKSSFSDAYDVEVYQNAALTEVVLKQRIKTNFYYLKDAKAGPYYWRVRAVSKTVPSAYSATGSFILK